MTSFDKSQICLCCPFFFFSKQQPRHWLTLSQELQRHCQQVEINNLMITATIKKKKTSYPSLCSTWLQRWHRCCSDLRATAVPEFCSYKAKSKKRRKTVNDYSNTSSFQCRFLFTVMRWHSTDYSPMCIAAMEPRRLPTVNVYQPAEIAMGLFTAPLNIWVLWTLIKRNGWKKNTHTHTRTGNMGGSMAS